MSTDVTTAHIYPANNCTRKCGSVDIPFPFGLDNESDCYRDSTFALSCKETTPPVLQYEDINVIDIDTEMGEQQLEIVGYVIGEYRLYIGMYWYIPYDSSCENARMNKSLFACVSEHVTCRNINGSKGVPLGYVCGCEQGYTGNPYIMNGCQDTAANIHPADNCTRKCASVDIPFPFGLKNESDCYRDSSFALLCNQTTTPPVLQYLDKNVSKVGVERGELYLMEVRNSSEGLTLTEGHYVYSWFIPYHSCENARMNKSLFACVGERSTCNNINGSEGAQLGYRCGCEKGYTGNPYIKDGCQGIYLKTLPS